MFDCIALEVARWLKAGDRVYFLASESKTSDSGLIYPAIGQYHHQMTFIPHDNGTIEQFLFAKDILISDGMTHIDVCGVAYDSCVNDLHQMLLGNLGNSTLDYYVATYTRLDWTKEKFKQILTAKLRSRIRPELTDKL